MDFSRHQLLSLVLFLVLSVFFTPSSSAQVTVTPPRVNVLIGGQAQFLCYYTPDFGRSCDDTFVFWGKKGGNTIANMTYVIDPDKYDIIWKTTVEGDVMRCLYTLIVKDVRNSDNGQYSCALIRPDSGRFYIAQSVGKLQVVIPPPADYPICRTSVIAGHSVADGMTLICESLTGQPAVSLKWLSGDYELPAKLHKLNGNQLLQLETTMTSLDLDRLTNAVITCVMDLPDPIEEIRTCSINTTTTVRVQETRVEDSATQITTFTCHVASNIPYHIDWFLDDRLINEDEPFDRFFVETKAQALHIRDLTAEDNQGTITCQVATMFGNFTGTAILDTLPNDENKDPITLDGSNLPLLLGIAAGILFLFLLLNILLWYKCRRRPTPSKAAKLSPKSAEESTPLTPISNYHSAAYHGKAEVVTKSEIRCESQYLDMSKPVKKIAESNNAHYSPMKSVSQASDNVHMAPTDNGSPSNENEYLVGTKADDADTYMYSSTDDLNKSNGKNTPKPVIKLKPSKSFDDIIAPSEVKSVSEKNLKQNAGKKAFGLPKLATTLSDDQDADNYEVLAKDVQQNPTRPKLNKMTSAVQTQASPTSSAASSPKLIRNLSAPLLSQEPPEYAVPNDTYDIASPTSEGKATPVYDIPNENCRKSPNVNYRLNANKAAERSPSPLLKTAMRPPLAHKKLQRHSDPPSASDNEPSPKKTSSRISLPQDEAQGQYLVPSVSQQNLDQIKPPTPTQKEAKSPLPKKAKKLFKAKNNNMDTYQCLDRQSMDLEKPDYQALLGLRKVDDCRLYENVGTESV